MYDEVDSDSGNLIPPTGPPPDYYVRDYRFMNTHVHMSLGLPQDDGDSDSSEAYHEASQRRAIAEFVDAYYE